MKWWSCKVARLRRSIVSPHSSSNSQCRSERAMPVGWYSRAPKDGPLQRLRRTAPMK